MPYLSNLHIDTEKRNPYPFNVSAIEYAKDIPIDDGITFFIGDNGCGKSTLIESIAFLLQLPHMNGDDYPKSEFFGAVRLAPYLKLKFNIDMPLGFFFRAEDFGDYINSVYRADKALDSQLVELEDEVPEDVIALMKENANFQRYQMRKNYGQELNTFSHGEAYLKIIQEKVSNKGIFILDEPEAALSPSRQLSLIYHIMNHREQYMSQFIIATHSPILMSLPGARIYEITENGMQKTALEDTEHYKITKSFLNDPELYLRHLR